MGRPEWNLLDIFEDICRAVENRDPSRNLILCVFGGFPRTFCVLGTFAWSSAVLENREEERKKRVFLGERKGIKCVFRGKEGDKMFN